MFWKEVIYTKYMTPVKTQLHASRFMFRISCFMLYVSSFMFHFSRFMFCVSCFTCHASRFEFHVSPFMFHLSCFTFHVSRFMFPIIIFAIRIPLIISDPMIIIIIIIISARLIIGHRPREVYTRIRVQTPPHGLSRNWLTG